MSDGETKRVGWGSKSGLPVVGNWNADAVSDLGVWDTHTGVFSERLTHKRISYVRFGRVR
jgi:hypothetical protein